MSMVNDLVEQCSKLALTSKEKHVIDVGDDADDVLDDKLSLRMVGRVVTTKTFEF